MSFHLNSPVSGLTSEGILARANLISASVKILYEREALSATYVVVIPPKHRGRDIPVGLGSARKLRHRKRGPDGAGDGDTTADAALSLEYHSLLIRTVFGARGRGHAHVHPPPPGQAVDAVQPAVHGRHKEAGEEGPDRGEDLDQGVTPSQLVRLEVARADVHDRREVAGFKKPNATNKSEGRRGGEGGREQTHKKRKT